MAKGVRQDKALRAEAPTRAAEAAPRRPRRVATGKSRPETRAEPRPDTRPEPRPEVRATPRARRIAPLPPADGADINLGYLSDFVGFHLRLAQDASSRVFSRHREKDLMKPGRFPALAIIQLNPGISQSALGRAIARDKSTVSPLIKDLQQNGFISRKPSPRDRRSVTLALTKKGERTLAKLHARATEHEDELNRLVGASKARFVTTLEKIVAGMAAHAPG